MSFITCGSKNLELPYLDKMILKAFSTSEEHFRTMCSSVSSCFGGCHAEAAPQRCSWMKPQGAQRPWGAHVEEVSQAGGSSGWLQASRTVGLPGQRRGARTPRRAALLSRLCEHDGCHRYSKLISCSHTGRPRISIVCS